MILSHFIIKYILNLYLKIFKTKRFHYHLLFIRDLTLVSKEFGEIILKLQYQSIDIENDEQAKQTLKWLRSGIQFKDLSFTNTYFVRRDIYLEIIKIINLKVYNRISESNSKREEQLALLNTSLKTLQLPYAFQNQSSFELLKTIESFKSDKSIKKKLILDEGFNFNSKEMEDLFIESNIQSLILTKYTKTLNNDYFKMKLPLKKLHFKSSTLSMSDFNCILNSLSHLEVFKMDLENCLIGSFISESLIKHNSLIEFDINSRRKNYQQISELIEYFSKNNIIQSFSSTFLYQSSLSEKTPLPITNTSLKYLSYKIFGDHHDLVEQSWSVPSSLKEICCNSSDFNDSFYHSIKTYHNNIAKLSLEFKNPEPLINLIESNLRNLQSLSLNLSIHSKLTILKVIKSLERNNSLTEVSFLGSSLDCLNPFFESNHPTIKSIVLDTIIEKCNLNSLISNKTIQKLCLHHNPFLSGHDILKILNQNSNIKEFKYLVGKIYSFNRDIFKNHLLNYYSEKEPRIWPSNFTSDCIDIQNYIWKVYYKSNK